MPPEAISGVDVAQGGLGIALTIGLTQVAKPFIADRYHPLLSLIFGIVMGGGMLLVQGADWITALINGIIVGLAASGLYDQKNLLKK